MHKYKIINIAQIMYFMKNNCFPKQKEKVSDKSGIDTQYYKFL